MSLESARGLRASGHHKQVRELLVALAQQRPKDAIVAYETACVHDYLGFEKQAVPFYLAALDLQLPSELRRTAYTGLGSTYRTLGMFAESRATLERGLQEFPEAKEMQVFLAMANHNLGASKSAVESLLTLLVKTTNDPQVRAYARAIEFYAQDLGRTWPDVAAAPLALPDQSP